MYLLKVNNRNTRTADCKACSKLTVKTPENNENTLLLTLNRFKTLLWCFCCLLTLNKYMGAEDPKNIYLLKVSNSDIRGVYWIMFRVNNKDIIKKSLKSLWCFYYSLLATCFDLWLWTSHSFAIKIKWFHWLKLLHFDFHGKFFLRGNWTLLCLSCTDKEIYKT